MKWFTSTIANFTLQGMHLCAYPLAVTDLNRRRLEFFKYMLPSILFVVSKLPYWFQTFGITRTGM